MIFRGAGSCQSAVCAFHTCCCLFHGKPVYCTYATEPNTCMLCDNLEKPVELFIVTDCKLSRLKISLDPHSLYKFPCINDVITSSSSSE